MTLYSECATVRAAEDPEQTSWKGYCSPGENKEIIKQ